MTSLLELGQRAKQASLALALASSLTKDAALNAAADLLLERTGEILQANASDVERAGTAGVAPAVIDRLRLSETRVGAMAGGLRQVAGLADPVGEVVEGWVRPNGLRIEKVQGAPGRGGHNLREPAQRHERRRRPVPQVRQCRLPAGELRCSGLEPGGGGGLAGGLRRRRPPRGLPRARRGHELRVGPGVHAPARGHRLPHPPGQVRLIQAVLDNATVPYVIDGDGNCHLYVDASADLDMALALLLNGKTQRPSVCNATESLVVHRDVAVQVPPCGGGFSPTKCPSRGRRRRPGSWCPPWTPATRGGLGKGVPGPGAQRPAWSTTWIRPSRMSSATAPVHTEAIVTADLVATQRFTREVDAAAVVVNASTRFTDGEQFGFGAEIGISTQKLHAHGPMGLRELHHDEVHRHG